MGLLQDKWNLGNLFSSSLLIGKKVVLRLSGIRKSYIFSFFKIVLYLHLDAERICLTSE